MDYEFLRDITGVVKVRMSMGHEAVGHWFNEEVKENLSLLDEVEQAVKEYHHLLPGTSGFILHIAGAIPGNDAVALRPDRVSRLAYKDEKAADLCTQVCR